MLNGSYGQTVMKDIFHELRIMDESDKIPDGYKAHGKYKNICEDTNLVKLKKITGDPTNEKLMCHEILAYSKVLMDILVLLLKAHHYPRIFYSDTDSIHLDHKWKMF